MLGLLLCTSFAVAVEQPLEESSTIRPVLNVQPAAVLVQKVLLTKEHALPQLTIDMDAEEAAVINAALTAIDDSKLTVDFINNVNTLSRGMIESDKAKIMAVLSSIDSLHQEKLILSAGRLFSGCDTEERLLIIKILSKTATDQIDDMTSHLNKNLINRNINKKTFLTEILNPVIVISQPAAPVIHAIPQIFTVDEALNLLGITEFRAKWVKKILVTVPPQRITRLFVDLLKSMPKARKDDLERTIKDFIAVPAERLTPKFEALINRLTDGMDGDGKPKVIATLAQVPGERLTSEFEALINRLTVATVGNEKSQVIAALAQLPAERLTPEFEALINRLTDRSIFERNDCKAKVIAELVKVLPERLTPEFEKLIIKLTFRMSDYNKSRIIAILSQAPAERLTPKFANYVSKLTFEMDEYSKSGVIKTLIELPAERLTPAFEACVNRLTFEMDEYSKSGVIKTLTELPAERLTPAFEACVNRLTVRMDSDDKRKVIAELATLPPERLTQDFETRVNWLANGMGQKNWFIINLAKHVSVQYFSEFCADFTTQRMHFIRQFMDQYQIEALLSRLNQLPTSNARITEINRTITLYIYDEPAPNYAAVGRADIHAYARMTVSTGATEKKQTLNDAVVNRLKKELNEQGLVPYNVALQAISQHAHQKYDQTMERIAADSTTSIIEKSAANAKALQERNWQCEALGAAKDDRNAQETLSLVYTLLYQQPEKLELWLNTYLEESLNARTKDTRSCVAGMRERVITSLRSVISQIEDKTGVYKDIHDLFNQAEGPALANKFLETINLTNQKNHKKIANLLSQAGITQQSSADQAVRVFGDHVKKSLATYNLGEVLVSYVEAATGQLEEYFDKNLRGLLTSTTSSAAGAAGCYGFTSFSASTSGAGCYGLTSSSSFLPSSSSVFSSYSTVEQTKKRAREDDIVEEKENGANVERVDPASVDTHSSSISARPTLDEVRAKRLKVVDPNYTNPLPKH